VRHDVGNFASAQLRGVRDDTENGNLQSIVVDSQTRCHILIGDVMCLSYMTGVVRLERSARTAKDHLLAGERAARSPSHFRAEELLELLGYHVRLVLS
jgi:hypothetical protein